MLHLLFLALPSAQASGELPAFQPLDVFELEWADDPRLSPDGKRVVYVRNGFDVMTDRARASLWIVDVESGDERPLVTGDGGFSSPRWSPKGDRLLYVGSEEGGAAQIYCRWMDTGATTALTHLTEAPAGLSWSPDGREIAFTAFVPKKPEPLVEPPAMPEGATWADPPRVIERLVWRADGGGIAEEGYRHVFVLPADGGTARQVTEGDFDHGEAPAWTADGRSLVVSANRGEKPELHPLDTDLWRVDLASGEIAQVTRRPGPDGSPAVSPDGRSIAYVGFDDKLQGYQVTRLCVLAADGQGEPRVLTSGLDRDVAAPLWSPDGQGIFFLCEEEGDGCIGYADLAGKVEMVARDVGGTTLDRPYSSGAFTVGPGRIAFTRTRPERPADVAVARRGSPEARVLTRLNEDVLARRALAPVEELRVPSSADGRSIQAWVAKPPGFDPAQKYPLVLEIHGGPFANYGARFSADVQLYAAAGYVVVYANPRGSTSYGEEFGNLIHHNYPGQDYDDLMSVIDAVVAQGYVDPENLFVTGGSGGGVLSAWIVGRTDRFRAAVVAKPVINWVSFSLTADAYPFFTRYWFPGPPWENLEHYWKRSPLSLVGNIKTPTMLLTGEQDLRTPISESEQLYQALKLREVPTALVRVPGASHDVSARPSHLIAKVAHVLAWFERYRKR